MGTDFKKLNEDWDANGGAPEPNLHIGESGLTLTFFLSASLNPRFRKYDRGEIFFPNCRRYRLGYPNDEGWDKGHCRFRCWAPQWGDFYEITGNLLDNRVKDWVVLRPVPLESNRHFLFYFKDETFECDADDWSFRVLPVSDADYLRMRASEHRIAFPRATLLTVVGEILLEPVRVVQRWFRR